MSQILINAGFSVYESIIIEWQFRYSVGFQTKLMELIAKADLENRYLLSIGFPEEVIAFTMFSEGPGWWQGVEKRYIEEFRANV